LICGETREKSQLNNLGLPWIFDFQFFQRLIQCYQVEVTRSAKIQGLI
jgi:hypothetical protein